MVWIGLRQGRNVLGWFGLYQARLDCVELYQARLGSANSACTVEELNKLLTQQASALYMYVAAISLTS
jgi:hypothetical protein